MNTNHRSPERIRLGQELHETEVALGVGRRALSMLRIAGPIDEVAVTEARAVVDAARMGRNQLRAELAILKVEETDHSRSSQPAWLR